MATKPTSAAKAEWHEMSGNIRVFEILLTPPFGSPAVNTLHVALRLPVTLWHHAVNRLQAPLRRDPMTAASF